MRIIQDLSQVTILCSERSDGDFRGQSSVEQCVRGFVDREINLTHLQLEHGVVVATPQHEITVVADAAVTSRGSQGISMVVGDCFPIVLVDQQSGLVALIHGGWRSLAAGIMQKTLAMLQQRGADSNSLWVWIGPGARSCCYRSAKKPSQINEHDWSSVISKVSRVEQENTSSKNEWQIDLPMYITKSLIESGVQEKQIIDCKLCTVCHPHQFFSHQRSKQTGDVDGRFLVAVYWRS